MQKTILIALMAICFSFMACHRYENGPAWSLIPVSQRVVGDWQLADILTNDKHNDDLYNSENSLYFTINNDGTFVGSVHNYKDQKQLTGFWEFSDDKNNIIFTFISGNEVNSVKTSKITRLSRNELWLVDASNEYNFTTDLIERRFEKIKK